MKKLRRGAPGGAELIRLVLRYQQRRFGDSVAVADTKRIWRLGPLGGIWQD